MQYLSRETASSADRTVSRSSIRNRSPPPARPPPPPLLLPTEEDDDDDDDDEEDQTQRRPRLEAAPEPLAQVRMRIRMIGVQIIGG